MPLCILPCQTHDSSSVYWCRAFIAQMDRFPSNGHSGCFQSFTLLTKLLQTSCTYILCPHASVSEATFPKRDERRKCERRGLKIMKPEGWASLGFDGADLHVSTCVLRDLESRVMWGARGPWLRPPHSQSCRGSPVSPALLCLPHLGLSTALQCPESIHFPSPFI